MGYSIRPVDGGQWEWEVWFSAYGMASGRCMTLDYAKIELAIAQAELLEHPFPPSLKLAMRTDPERYANDYPDPPDAWPN